MYAGCVQWIITVCNTHETCALLKCLGTKLCYFQELLTVGKSAVSLSVVYDILGNCLADTGDILQKWCRCGIQVNTDLIYRVFYYAVKRFTQLLLVHVMLILSYTDGLRVNLN